MGPIAWEYLILPLPGQPQADADALNHVGADGWQLVNVIDVKGELQAFLKRPILDDQAGWDDAPLSQRSLSSAPRYNPSTALVVTHCLHRGHSRNTWPRSWYACAGKASNTTPQSGHNAAPSRR